MFTLIPYTVYLAYHLALKIPNKSKEVASKINLETISITDLTRKQRYVSIVGSVMLFCNSAILMFKQSLLTRNNAFYLEFSEIYLSNIFICIFIVKNAKICMSCVVFCVVCLNVFNYFYMDDEEFIDN